MKAHAGIVVTYVDRQQEPVLTENKGHALKTCPLLMSGGRLTGCYSQAKTVSWRLLNGNRGGDAVIPITTAALKNEASTTTVCVQGPTDRVIPGG